MILDIIRFVKSKTVRKTARAQLSCPIPIELNALLVELGHAFVLPPRKVLVLTAANYLILSYWFAKRHGGASARAALY
jgi:hypothetical protein